MNVIVHVLQKLPVLALVVLAASSVIIGDIFAKYWSYNQRNVFYALAILFYMGSAILYMPSLLKEGLIITSLIWTLVATIGLLFVGIVIFKESLSLLQIGGVVLGITALTMLSFGK